MRFRNLSLLLFIATLAVPLTGRTQTKVSTVKELNTTRWYPFRVDEKGLTAEVNLADARIEQYYGVLFKKHGYMGTSLTWDSMVAEMISAYDVDFMINNDLDLITEGNTFTISASTRTELENVLKIVQPTFAVIAKLEVFVKSVDPTHIKDGHPEIQHP